MKASYATASRSKPASPMRKPIWRCRSIRISHPICGTSSATGHCRTASAAARTCRRQRLWPKRSRKTSRSAASASAVLPSSWRFQREPAAQIMPRHPPEEPRAWQRMLSGRRLDLLNPSPLDIEIEDIAHGLARVARWNGQTKGAHAFSVAQHSLLVEQIACHFDPALDRTAQLAALLHDAPEYVIGDM